jgi:hypothetical protein
MGQVLLTRNTIERALDTFTVSVSEIERDQIQPVCKRRKLIQAAEDCERFYTANDENHPLYDIDVSASQGTFFSVTTVVPFSPAFV